VPGVEGPEPEKLFSSIQGRWHGSCVKWRGGDRIMSLIALIVLIVVLLAVLPTWPHSSGWGYYPSGGVGLVVLILIILLLTGRL